MGRTLRIVICGVTLFALLFLNQPNDVTAQSSQAWDIYRLINEFRAEQGLPALQYNEALSVAAVEQAERMRDNFHFSTHVWADGSSPQSRARDAGYQSAVSEVIVGGWQWTAVEGMIWWRNSPIHYRELSKFRYDEVGVAFATTGKTHFYVAVLGDADLVLYAPHSVGGAGSEAGGAGEVVESVPDYSPPPLIITPIPLSLPREDGAIVHTVGEGQALWTIAAHYKIKIDRLLQLNGLSADDFVQPGDEIFIQLPDGVPIPTPLPTPTPSPFYTVQEGDTPSDVALQFGITVQELYLFNGLSERDLIFIGDVLRIRWDESGQNYPPTATPDIWYSVKEGDTIWTIAAVRGVSAEFILDINDLSASDFLSPGQRLMVATIPPTNTPAPTSQATSKTTPTPTRVLRATPTSEITAEVTAIEIEKPISTPEPPEQPANPPTNNPTPNPQPLASAPQSSINNASVSPSISISGIILILFSLLIYNKTRKLD